MGTHKDEMIRAEDNWKRGGARCSVCAQPVPLEERETYFETGMCDYCRHQSERDD